LVIALSTNLALSEETLVTDFCVKSSGTTVLADFLFIEFITDLYLLLLSVVGNLKERDHLGDPSVDGRIILKWIFSNWNVEVCTGWSWLRIRTAGGHL